MKWNDFFNLVRLKLIEGGGQGAYQDTQIVKNAHSAARFILISAPLELMDNYNIFKLTYTFEVNDNSTPPYSEISLPTQFVRLLSFEYYTGSNYKMATYYDLNEFLHKVNLFPSDTTPIFTKFGNSLLVAPKYRYGYSYILRYIANNLSLEPSPNDDFNFSTNLIEPLIFYTCGLISLDDGNYQGASSFFNLSMSTLQQYIASLSITPPRIGITPEEEKDIMRGSGRLIQK